MLLNGGTDSANAIDVFSGATLGGTGTLDPVTLTIHSRRHFRARACRGTFMTVTGNLVLQSGRDLHGHDQRRQCERRHGVGLTATISRRGVVVKPAQARPSSAPNTRPDRQRAA